MAVSYRVRTQAYSGPFDLLLSLVSRQKVDIGQVAISQVAEQYLAEVDAMGELDLDVASDFLLVAATLLEIKAAALVPNDLPKRQIDDDDDEDLSDLTPEQAREVLIARLIAYKQFRNAGAALGSRMESESLMEPRTAGPDPEFLGLMPDFLEGITLRSLAVICADLDSRRESLLLEAEHVAPKRLPIALTVASVDRITISRPQLTFSELLDGDESAETVVATFLAVLELFKRGSIVVQQSEAFGEIDIVRVEGAPAFELDENLITSIEEES